MVTVRVCLKLKTSWKSVAFTNKVEKNSRYFLGVFNKTVIPLGLAGYEMIIINSALRAFSGIIVKYKMWQVAIITQKRKKMHETI